MMSFQMILKFYLQQLDCSLQELGDASGLSVSTISRYSSGSRTPSADSDHLIKLSEGIVKLSAAKGNASSDLTFDAVIQAFKTALPSCIEVESFSDKINYFMEKLNISTAELSKALYYDASFLSRIRSGKRMPSDPILFMHKFAEYLVQNYPPDTLLSLIKGKAAAPGGGLSDESSLSDQLVCFLLSDSASASDQTFDFLCKLNDFDLNEYIRAIHFDDLKVPFLPFQLPSHKEYQGIRGQKDAELGFLMKTVFSGSKQPVFMCSDMDMEDMSKDMEFSKNWMLGLAGLLKRGLNIYIIHNLNRPWNELMIGLEAWIPLYMTGQVIPFYLDGIHNDIYQHLLYISSACVLSGESIRNHHNKARLFLSNRKNDLNYYRQRAEALIKKALPLMEIYTRDKAQALKEFAHTADKEAGERRYLSSSLPLFTLSKEFLASLLTKNRIPEARDAKLLERFLQKKEEMSSILAENKLTQEIPLISREEFQRHPLVLNLTELGPFPPLSYSYGEYKTHIKESLEFADRHENYDLKLCENFAFRNMEIKILKGKWVWITKTNSPAIHFIIRHPQLCGAIENIQTPLYDQ